MPAIPTILLFGATGAGKSSLVNRALGSNVPVGHGLKSCTSRIEAINGDIAGIRCSLVDVPGFDDSIQSDSDNLRNLCDWLAQAKRNGINFCALLYLHRITDSKVGGVAQTNMRLFRKICGDSSMSRVILCTTRWDEVATADGERREAELRSDFWKPMLDLGASMERHDNSTASARRIVSAALKKSGVTLEVQRQMVDEGRAFAETAAASALNEEMARREAAQIQLMRELGAVNQRTRAEQMARVEQEKRRQQEQERELHELLGRRRARQEAEREGRIWNIVTMGLLFFLL